MSQLAILRLNSFFLDPEAPERALARGSRGAFVQNVRRALDVLQCEEFRPPLSFTGGDEQLYDEPLEDAVRTFQSWQDHSSTDGVIGPGTRRLLAQTVWENCGFRFLTVLENHRPDPRPRAFLSHSSSDSRTVEQIEAYLQDHSVQVVRYTYSFTPGHPISEEIEGAVAVADKVVVFGSHQALESSWVQHEIRLAEDLERAIHQHLLVYVLLEPVTLDAAQDKRIVIPAAGRRLRDVGNDLLRALYGPTGPPQRSYDPEAVL